MKGPYVLTWVARLGTVERRVVLHSSRENPIKFRAVSAAAAAFDKQFHNRQLTDVWDVRVVPLAQWLVEEGM